MANCEVCGKPITARRSTKKYCGNTCAQKAHRAALAAEKKSREMMMTLEGYALVEKLRKIAPAAAASVEKLIEVQGVGCTEAAVKLALTAYSEAHRVAVPVPVSKRKKVAS